MAEKAKDDYESKMVAKFIDDLANGTSILQKPNNNPEYVQNFFSKTTYTGMNFLNMAQGLEDQGKKLPFVGSINQANFNKSGLKSKDENEGQSVKMVGIATFWHKEKLDSERNVIKDENGKAVSGYNDTIMFSVEDMMKKSYNRDTKVFKSEGSVLPKMTKVDLPPFVQNPQETYKAKDSSGQEVLMEKVSQGLRGKYQGNFEGITISPKQIEAIKKDFIQHPKLFAGVVNKADAYARSDMKAIAQIENYKGNKSATTQKESKKTTVHKR